MQSQVSKDDKNQKFTLTDLNCHVHGATVIEQLVLHLAGHNPEQP